MNKRDLIDALSGRLGDKKSATEALNAVLETIQSAVASGDKVAITGFGVFEKSDRPARTARNPATGAEIHVAAPSRCRSSARARTSRRLSTAARRAAAKPAAKASGGQEEVAANCGPRHPAEPSRDGRCQDARRHGDLSPLPPCVLSAGPRLTRLSGFAARSG